MHFTKLPFASVAAVLVAVPIAATAQAKANDAGIDSSRQGPSGDEFLEIARTLCLEAVRRRFGIDPEEVTGHSFAGGGDSREEMEGSATISLFGPPARDYRCEIVRGRVTSTALIDAEGRSIEVEPAR